jgi:hypothetical protein
MTADARAHWSRLANDISQIGLDILSGAPFTVSDKRLADPKVLAIMLMSRSLSNFRGVVTLIDAGLIVEARVLARCCFENAFWIAHLHADGDKFVRKMLRDELRSRKVRGELALSKGAALSDEARTRLRAQLREINKGYSDAQSLNPRTVAMNGLLADGYLLYSQLSADAAHPTVTSLNRHVAHENGEPVIDVAPAPADPEIVMTLDWACNAMLGVCVGVNQILGNTPAGQGLRALGDRYYDLTIQPAGAAEKA